MLSVEAAVGDRNMQYLGSGLFFPAALRRCGVGLRCNVHTISYSSTLSDTVQPHWSAFVKDGIPLHLQEHTLNHMNVITVSLFCKKRLNGVGLSKPTNKI